MEKPGLFYVVRVNLDLFYLGRSRHAIYRSSLESSALFYLTADGKNDGRFASFDYPIFFTSMRGTLESVHAALTVLERRHYDAGRIAAFRARLEPFRAFVEAYPTGEAYLDSRLNADDKTSEEEDHLQRGRRQKALDELLAGNVEDNKVPETVKFITGKGL